MAADEIQREITFNAKFDALCKANGVKINESHNRGSGSFRERMLLKQQKKYGALK